MPSQRVVALLVNTGRVGLGATLLANPTLVRVVGIDRASAARMSWLARIAAARDVALGTGAVVAVLRGRGQRAWLLAGVACDMIDAVVSAQAAQQQRVDPLRGRLMAGLAASSALAGVASGAGLRGTEATEGSATVRAREAVGTAAAPDR